MHQQYGIPRDVAVDSAASFLRAFRACPDDESYELDEWHELLWRNSLPKNYRHITSKYMLSKHDCAEPAVWVYVTN